MLGLKLNHVSKRGHMCHFFVDASIEPQWKNNNDILVMDPDWWDILIIRYQVDATL